MFSETVHNGVHITYKYVLQQPSEMQIHSILKQFPFPARTGLILSHKNPNFQHRLCQSPPTDTIFRKFCPPLLHPHTLPSALPPSVYTLGLPHQIPYAVIPSFILSTCQTIAAS